MNPRTTFEIPTGLTRDARKLAYAIRNYLSSEGVEDTSSGRAFYSPGEWRDRGEQYGTRSALVVVYDGNGVAPYFSLDATAPPWSKPEAYHRYEAMMSLCREHGFYFEEATGWYACIYPIGGA